MSGQVQVLQTIQPILTTLADSAASSADAVAAQVWLIGPGDLCADCPRRSECPDRTSCLHLAATAGALDAAAVPGSRLPFGTNPVGRAASAGGTLVERSDLAALGVAEAAWLRRAGIKVVAVLPLPQGRQNLGTLVVLLKSKPSDEQLRSLAGTARLGAEAIGNVEAYRTLAAERNRLAAKNARLRGAPAGGSDLGQPEDERPAPATPAPAPASVPESAPLPAAGTPAGTGAMLHSERFTLPPLRSFAQIQREGILHALEHTGWRVSGPRGAAAALGLKPTTLESKMKRLGIRRPR